MINVENIYFIAGLSLKIGKKTQKWHFVIVDVWNKQSTNYTFDYLVYHKTVVDVSFHSKIYKVLVDYNRPFKVKTSLPHYCLLPEIGDTSAR